jgi:hypothetical protein
VLFQEALALRRILPVPVSVSPSKVEIPTLLSPAGVVIVSGSGNGREDLKTDDDCAATKLPARGKEETFDTLGLALRCQCGEKASDESLSDCRRMVAVLSDCQRFESTLADSCNNMAACFEVLHQYANGLSYIRILLYNDDLNAPISTSLPQY